MAILKTFDLKGNKLSFANWISNLSPCDTPFTSMINKEAVDQTQYSWQHDYLSAPDATTATVAEGAAFVSPTLRPTTVAKNFTQILRKVVKITDTANKVGLYGRANELTYQMEKAGREIKRDLEVLLLTNGAGNIGTGTQASKVSGFLPLVAAKGAPDKDTGAIVHLEVTGTSTTEFNFTIHDIFDLTYNLYLAGSKANKIMVHPKHMAFFSDLIGFDTSLTEMRMFDNVDTKFNMHVGQVRDPLGQDFTVIPNRFMPEDKIFFFNENDWTQMILRAPTSTKLAKNGSSEKHMIEMEIGLRHRNPYASGVIVLKKSTKAAAPVEAEAKAKKAAK